MARLFVLIAAFVATVSAMHVSVPAATVSSSRSSSPCGATMVPAQLRAARTQQSAIAMAVPKKRQSKMKTRQRKANWYAKARRQAQLALSRGKSVNYNPLEDPKYAFGDADDEDEDDDDEDDE